MKNLLVLGATSDIGQAIARRFASAGWGLTLAARDLDALEPLAADLRLRTSATVATRRFDALDFDSHRGFYDTLPAKPDAAVCVFGYMGDQTKARIDLDEVRKTIDTNYTGAVSILNVVAGDFEKRAAGTIIGVGSVAGDRGRQSNYIYGSAKAGFAAYLSGLRNRLAVAGVHVMTVKPGFVRTKMTEHLDLPAALTAEPEQVADAVFRGLQRRRNTVYVLWPWLFIMLVIKHLPEPLFKRMKL